MPAFLTIEIRDAWQFPPFPKSQFLQKANAAGIDVQQDSDQGLDPPASAFFHDVGDQPGADAHTPEIFVDVVTDLRRMSKCHATRSVRAQAAPPYDSRNCLGDENRIMLGQVPSQPVSPAFDRNGRQLGSRLLRRHRLIVDFNNGRKVIGPGDSEVQSHSWPQSIPGSFVNTRSFCSNCR
jgi:hypothetical protein